MPSLETCTQPECLLREQDVDSRSLAELVVRVLAGEDVSELMAGKPSIHPYARCVDCTLRVFRGGKPLPTVEEVERLLEAGHWSHRRSRRRAKREEHGAADRTPRPSSP